MVPLKTLFVALPLGIAVLALLLWRTSYQPTPLVRRVSSYIIAVCALGIAVIALVRSGVL